MSDYDFHCFVEGDDTSFPIVARSDKSIGVLKDLIMEKKKNSLQGIDAVNLTLRKVHVEFSVELENKFKTGRYQPDNGEELFSWKRISEEWPKPPPQDHLNIFVILPAALVQTALGKQSRDAGDSTEAVEWLTEVHSKIWTKENLRPHLFRKVEVTRADYDALQNLLKEQHSDRDSPDYDGNKPDVLSVKLKFLQSLTQAEASSPPHPDDNDDLDAREEDDTVLESLFPCFISFLDLSILNLKETAPSRLPLPLLIRKEYEHISDLIKEQPQNFGGSVIISGQPGTGKTVYLYLKIIERMIEGCPFLYQDIEGVVYHVAGNGVEVVKSWRSKKPIVAFVDGDGGKVPDRLISRYPVQLIVASSPKDTYSKWAKQLGPGSRVSQLAIKLWSPKEFLLAGMIFHHFDHSLTLLRESAAYLGYNPRRCFQISSIKILRQERRIVTSVITETASNWSSIMRLLRNTRTGVTREGAFNVSHTIFEIFPTNEDRLLAGCHYRAVSRWALDLLLTQYEVAKTNAAAELYLVASGSTSVAPLRGFLFERQVLIYLCSINGERERPYKTSRLTGSLPPKWAYNGPIRHFAFEETTVIDAITQAVQENKPLHLIPLVRNFAAADSILYQPNDPDAVLTCIQVTRSPDHPISVPGLQHVQNWFKVDSPLKDLRPSKDKPWRLLFVVPTGLQFGKQRYKDKNNAESVEWAGKVHQSVLGLKEETIFSDSSIQHATTSLQGGQQTMVIDNNQVQNMQQTMDVDDD